MSDFQMVILVGNATKDAQQKQAQETDTMYTTFRLGVSNAKGESTYFPVVVFGKSQDSVAQYVKKGASCWSKAGLMSTRTAGQA